MKSNICKLNKDLTCLEAVLAEVEKVTTYNALEDKKALRLRLLAEELCGMLPGLVENFNGEFWAENEGDNYELHVELKADDMSIDLRDELISVSNLIQLFRRSLQESFMIITAIIWALDILILQLLLKQDIYTHGRCLIIKQQLKRKKTNMQNLNALSLRSLQTILS